MPVTHSTSRLEAFSDGVIAVIVTIMVLELKVPIQNGFAGIHAVLPVLLIYLLSFAFTAVYWINHHHLVDRIEHVDPLILYSNLVFLLLLSLIPFFTSWVLEKHLDPFSVALYAVSFIATGLGFGLLRLAVDRRLRLLGKLEPENVAEQRKHLISLVLYLIAIPLALRLPRLALALLALVNILWIIPTASPKRMLHKAPAQEPVDLHRSGTPSLKDPTHP